jgi:N,N'-diacetyllegionaminate synthase
MPKSCREANSIVIGGRRIAHDAPIFIIAEVGVNHNGDMVLAKKTITAAKESGVDCVKFQLFNTKEFMADSSLMYEYVSEGKPCKENMTDMFKRLELSSEQLSELYAFAHAEGIIPFCSVADREALACVEALGGDAFKLSSEDLINLPLVEAVCQKKGPVIFSTGMASEEEIEDVLALLKQYNKENVMFLHCISLYPTNPSEVNMQRVDWLKEKTGCLVGFSDHTIGNTAAVLAISKGAKVIEKHFTLDKNLPGPDHSFSLDPRELVSYVNTIRDAEEMLKLSKNDISPREEDARRQFRRSIVAKKSLNSGHVISLDDVALKRPGYGLRAREMDDVVGKTVTVEIAKDAMITWENIQ